MENYFYSTLFILLLLLGSCSSSSNAQEETLGAIDLSPDDSHIVFSYFKNDISSLYQGTVDGKNINLLIKSKDNASYVSPKFSSDGKKILFISFPHKTNLSNLFLADSDGKNIRQITSGDRLIVEAIFSSDGTKIFFTQATEYSKYSPIGREAPHNMDIYSLDLKTAEIKRVTNLKAYSINTLSQINNQFIAMRVEKGIGGGLFAFSTQNPDSLISLAPTNNPRNDHGLYYDPTYSEKIDKMAFTAPYEIYVMSFNDRIATKIYRSNSHIKNLIFYHNQQKLLFVHEGKRLVMSINADGTDLKTISLDIK